MKINDIFSKVYLESCQGDNCEQDKNKIVEVCSKMVDGKNYMLGKDGNGEYYFSEYGPDGWEKIGEEMTEAHALIAFEDLIKNSKRHDPWGWAKDDDEEDDEGDEDFEYELMKQGISPRRRGFYNW